MGGQGSGGAFGGPQYSPMNVSPNGGAGQSGNNTQAKMYIPGMKQMGSTGQATYEQQGGAGLYATPSTPAMSPITPLTAPSNFPGQDVMDGARLGPGATSVPNLPQALPDDPDMRLIQENLPLMDFWASQPGSSQATKDYVTYLKTLNTRPGGMS